MSKQVKIVARQVNESAHIVLVNFRARFWEAYADLMPDRTLRAGQRLMLALYVADPELHDLVVGTDVDCFHDDSKIEAFKKEISL